MVHFQILNNFVNNFIDFISTFPEEKSFYKLHFIKSYLRSTLVQEMLFNLTSLLIEDKLCKITDYNDIKSDFVKSLGKANFMTYIYIYIYNYSLSLFYYLSKHCSGFSGGSVVKKKIHLPSRRHGFDPWVG